MMNYTSSLLFALILVAGLCAFANGMEPEIDKEERTTMSPCPQTSCGDKCALLTLQGHGGPGDETYCSFSAPSTITNIRWLKQDDCKIRNRVGTYLEVKCACGWAGCNVDDRVAISWA